MDPILSFNTETSDFECIAKHNGKEYNVNLLDFTANDMEVASRLANRVCEWLDENFERVTKFVANELLSLKNDQWLEEDEPAVSEADFLNTIELDGLNVFTDGSFEVLFKDGDLFWGHWINVDIDSDFNLRQADLWG